MRNVFDGNRNIGLIALALAFAGSCDATTVTNGDFEAGLTPWTIIYPLGPDPAGHLPSDVISISHLPSDVHGGSSGIGIRNPGWQSQAGAIIGVMGMISQDFDTVPGQSYLLSYWMRILDTVVGTDLTVAAWGDAKAGCDWATIVPGNQLGAPCGVVGGSWTLDVLDRDWTLKSFVVNASSNRSTIVLAGRSDFSRVSFDDVTLTPIGAVPEPASLLLLATGVLAVAAHRCRAHRRA